MAHYLSPVAEMTWKQKVSALLDELEFLNPSFPLDYVRIEEIKQGLENLGYEKS